MNRRTLLSSFALVAAVAAVYIGATGALFTATSEAQTHVLNAGGVSIEMSDIDHNYNKDPDAEDPTGFDYAGGSFSFADLKPLDWGELLFTIGNGANEAHVCAYIDGEVPTQDEDLAFYDLIQFYLGNTQMLFGQWVSLGTVDADGAIEYGVDYCFGLPTLNSGGITFCGIDPDADYNAAQNGTFSADIYLFAIQTRNNEGFTCDAIQSFNPETGEVDIDYGYLPGPEETLVGATTFAYEPVAPLCDITVDANAVDPVAPVYNTLTEAVGAANDNDTICVDTGTYTENVTVDVLGVTIVGLNDPTDASDKATLLGRMDITEDDVTVRGLEFTNPNGAYGIVASGVSGTVIDHNVFTDIGSDSAHEGSAQAIYLVGGAAVINDFTVSNNLITNIGHLALVQGAGSGSSAKGVFVGDSTGNGTINGLVIENNRMENIKASTNEWTGVAATNGRGAYGVLINYGSGSTGVTNAPLISNNTVTDLEGLWVHAIGLEADTPGAEVSFNDVSDLTEHKAGTDGFAVFFESNPNNDMQVNFNNFAANMPFGVGFHPSNPAITVDAQFNWWGSTDPSTRIDEQAGTIDFEPFQLVPYGNN